GRRADCGDHRQGQIAPHARPWPRHRSRGHLLLVGTGRSLHIRRARHRGCRGAGRARHTRHVLGRSLALRARCRHPPRRRTPRVGALPGIDAVLTRAEASERYELPYEREADLVVTGDRNTVIGARAAEHDLSALAGHRLRSHGGTYEQSVPFLLSRPLTPEYLRLSQSQRLRNFAIFEFALNGVVP